MDQEPKKPAKSVKRPKKRTSPTRNVEPLKPPPSALVDSTTIAHDLREFIYNENKKSQKYAIGALLDAAEKYRAEMGRSDGAHRARMNKREEVLFQSAEDLTGTHHIFSKLTYRDLDDWKRRMEWAAERERNKPAPKPVPAPIAEKKPDAAPVIPFRRRPVDPE